MQLCPVTNGLAKTSDWPTEDGQKDKTVKEIHHGQSFQAVWKKNEKEVKTAFYCAASFCDISNAANDCDCE